jgi:hypothetical protein
MAGSLSIFALAGCELNVVPQRSPTVAGTPDTATPSPSATQAPNNTATLPAATLIPQIESPSHTWTPGPPTVTLTPSQTPGPYEYVIQPNDTLLYIIQQPPFNYRDTNVLNQILALNPQITSIDRLPPPGSTILIPRQTVVPTPEGYELTLAVMPVVTQPGVPENAEIVTYEVKEGETIIGIAEGNATSLRVLATLNPDISFAGCDFNSPFGGSGCSVSIVVGQQINVPALTPTPTLSPTFSGSETPTYTPTFPAPMAIFPQENANASARTFLLQWLSVGILDANQQYVVQIEDLTSGATHTGVTRTTSYELPAEMIPSDGQPHQIRWRVSIGVQNPDGTYRLVGGEAPWHQFTWASR